MKKKSFNVALFLLLLCFIRPAAANVSLLILGDSLSAGYGIAVADSWPSEIQRRWQSTHPEFKLINASISGETTEGALRRLPALIERHQPHWVFIELGGNDGLRGFNLSTMADNLKQIITLLQANNIRVALSEIEIPPNLGPRYTQLFNQTFHNLAANNEHIVLIPFFVRHIAVQPELMQADGIHPNRDAQVQIANLMEPQLRQLLLSKESKQQAKGGKQE
ncbi:arylesterase [Aliidiomarina quisquiliarum]|uniref:arylesterase n=1 Tax=Aliidiomarina quisquiliarum TaxID=2938947 RepID=UPI00208E6A52|nr:arylesterase [Aliidiomarina quisquiliarum]MCO4320151.1 arylesterase [Aliidiomarina quisquiliarum]